MRRCKHFPGQAKVSQLHDSLVVDQNVSAFDVSVHYAFRVHVPQTEDHLLQNKLQLHFCKDDRRLLDQFLEIVGRILKNQVNGLALRPDDVDQLHDVGVVQLLEDHDFTDRRDGEALLLSVHFDLFERVKRVAYLRLVDETKSTLVDERLLFEDCGRLQRELLNA